MTGRPVDQRSSLGGGGAARDPAGAQIVRVHDVAATRDAIAVWRRCDRSKYEQALLWNRRHPCTVARIRSRPSSCCGSASPPDACCRSRRPAPGDGTDRKGHARVRVHAGGGPGGRVFKRRVDVVLCGPLPTPAVAYLTRAQRLSAGVVISASHNPYQDNGIKFFSGSGRKLDDVIEQQIEDLLEQPSAASSRPSWARRAGSTMRPAAHRVLQEYVPGEID